MKPLPNRKPQRLKGFDYCTPGAYFITICTQNREYVFEAEPGIVGNALCGVPGDVNGMFTPNTIIHRYIREIENKFDNIIVNKYVIMPNHIHAIIVITERHAGRSLHDIVRWFKTMVSNEYIKGVKSGLFKPFEQKFWQKSFHDHIIRNEKDDAKIWEYIDNNPGIWETDCLYNK